MFNAVTSWYNAKQCDHYTIYILLCFCGNSWWISEATQVKWMNILICWV